MPITTQRFRQSIGYYDEREKGNQTDKVFQKKLNHLSASQREKMPQKLCLMTVLALLSVVSNTACRRNIFEKHTLSLDCCTKSFRWQKSGTDPSDVDNNISAGFQQNVTLCQQLNSPSSSTAIISFTPLPEYQRDPVSLKHMGIAIRHSLQLNYHRFSALLSHYDPLFLPGAEASAVHTPEIAQYDERVVASEVDHSCITARQNLTVVDILNKILDTIQDTVTTVALEVQLVSYYIKRGACPTSSEIEAVEKITKTIDNLITSAMSFFEIFSPLVILKTLVAPAIKMALNDLPKRNVSLDEINELNHNLIGYFRGVSHLSYKKLNPITGVETIEVPKGVTSENNYIYVVIDKKLWRLTEEEHALYASRDDITHKARYNINLGVWEIDSEVEDKKEIVDEDNPFNHFCEMRYRRGTYLGKPCIDHVEYDQSRQASSDLVYDPEQSDDVNSFSQAEVNIINEFDIGFSRQSLRVDDMVFSDGWPIYRVRDEDKLSAKVFYAVQMNDILVPIKAKTIYNNHLSCEIYDLNNINNSHRVEFYKGGWRFEPATSFYLSDELKDIIHHYAYHEFSSTDGRVTNLSVPGNHGFQVDKEGHAYLRLDNHYVKIHKFDSDRFISAKHGGRLYIVQVDGKYKLASALLERGALEINPREMNADMAMYSSKGLSSNKIYQLNYHWNLVHFNVKSHNYQQDDIIGSKINIMLRMKYNPNSFGHFIEPPDIQWREVIKANDNGQTWTYNGNMYENNRHNYTFYSWDNKYLLAYSFVKGDHINEANEPVRFYDKDMQPIDPTALPDVYTNKDKIKIVKNYLNLKGGVLDITISDYPKVFIIDEMTQRERLLSVNFGFLDNIIFSFIQGINLKPNIPRSVFVTTGTNVHLAEGPVNSSPPEYMTQKRVRK